jgi:hypothetical protein
LAIPKDANLNETVLNTPPGKTPPMVLFPVTNSGTPSSSAFIPRKSDQRKPNMARFDDVFGKSPATPGQFPTGIKKEFPVDFFDPRNPDYQGEDFGYLDAGAEKHNVWESLTVHTAKCDGCGKQNKSVLQRCKRCNKQLCKECISDLSGAAMEGHEADLDALVWDPPKVKRTPKPRVKRAITFKPGNQLDDASYGEKSRRPQAKKSKLEPSKKQRRTSNDTVYISDDSYDNRGMDDEEFSRKYDNYSRQKDWDREDEMGYDHMSNERLGHLYDKDHQRFLSGDKRSARLADVPETARHSAGARRPFSKHVGVAGAQKNDVRLGLTIDDMKGIQGESLDEVFTNVVKANEDKTEKEKLEEKLRADILETRLKNPEYRKLVAAGKEAEAEEMMESAATLIRMRQGLL